jgi:hypothetical protein
MLNFVIINIDDESRLDRTKIPQWDFSDVTSFLTALANDSNFKKAILNPENTICFLIDEHLPWGPFTSGREVYEFIGLFSQSLPEEARSRIFPFGVSSGNTAQLYMPETNRKDKRFQIIMANRPEKGFQRKEGENPYKSVAEIFLEDGYFNHELGVQVEYSEGARELVKFWKENKPNEIQEIEPKYFERLDDSNIA